MSVSFFRNRFNSSNSPGTGRRVTKIIAYDRFRPGVTMETIQPYLPHEVANVWRLWKAGIVRENYARADEAGVVIVFECGSVDECRRYTDDFPLTKQGFLEWFFIPLQIPLPIEALFRSDVDVHEPYDRTTIEIPVGVRGEEHETWTTASD